jgi:hypothetical protein
MKKFKEQPLSAPGPRALQDQPCFIYVLATIGKAGNCSPVKIGIASNPEKRLASIQTACPNPIRVQTFFGPMDRGLARAIEQEVHKFSAKRKLHGEWFDHDPAEAAGLVEDVIRLLLSRDTAAEILGDYSEHP